MQRHMMAATAWTDGCEPTWAVERSYKAGREVYRMLGVPQHLRIKYRPGQHHGFLDVDSYFDWFNFAGGVPGREKEIRGSGGSLEHPGPILTHLHTVYVAYFGCLPTHLDPWLRGPVSSRSRLHGGYVPGAARAGFQLAEMEPADPRGAA
jgi:hypothetical protein